MMEVEENSEKSSASSDSGSSNISDDEVDDANDIEIEKEISTLQQTISENLYNYSSHVELVKLLRKNGDFDQLRAARERMSSVFPLTSELWLEWLKDEMKYTEVTEREKIISLFERAIGDYVSVPLWLEYVQYSIGGMGDEGGIQTVRDTFERALTAAGLHVSSGAILWEAYREFETAIFAGMQPNPGAISSNEVVKQIEAQMARITKLFQRQLSIPLRGMENTFKEYKEWAGEEVNADIQHQYKKALAKYKERTAFEDELENSDPPHLASYDSYIAFEMKNGDPVRVISICERAIIENCLQTTLWLKYIRFMEDHLKCQSTTVRIYERAVRNCPWSVDVWVGYLRILESMDRSHQQVVDVFNRALASGFTSGSEFLTLWTAYLDYLRRRVCWNEEHEKELEDLRTAFEQAVCHLNQNHPLDGDPNCTLTQYWAFIEAKYCHNMSKARELWSTILLAGFNSQAAMCLEYVRLERAFGDKKHCRKLFQRIVHAVSDWPEVVCEAYINFEREEGDLESYIEAAKKCEAQLTRVRERREKEAAKEAQLAEQKKAERADKKKEAKSKMPPQQHNKKPAYAESNIRPYKSKSSASSSLASSGQWASSASDQQSTSILYVRGQKRKLAEDQSDTVTAEPEPVSSDISNVNSFKVPPPPGFKPKAVTSDLNEAPAKKQKVSEDSSYSKDSSVENAKKNYRDNCTTFVSNLDYATSSEQLQEVFSKVGEISEIRLIGNFKGRSKGYAYIEFKDELSAADSLKLDRQPIDGRPMFVSPCDRSSSAPKLKYNAGLEKNKLFVRGLPLTVTKEELQLLFAAHGKVKDVRLVTYRNGTPKGLAYVEYENEASASQAILKVDGLLLREHSLSVAISNPPARNTPQSDREQSSFIPSLGGGRAETERGKARTQLGLVPRSIQRTQQAVGPQDGKTNVSSAATDATTSDIGTTKMSNQDFRNMLLKK